MRTVVAFNDHWLFIPDDVGADTPDTDFQPVTLPHANKILPHHNFDNQEYQFVSTYRKRFKLPEACNGRRVYADFDGAMIACEVYLNGVKVGEHEGGFTPFSFDLTDYLSESGENVLTIKLDSSERPDIPPYGFVVDYLTFGGIYREAWLRYVEPCYIKDVFVRPQQVLTDKPFVEFDTRIEKLSGKALYLTTTLLDSDDRVLAHKTDSIYPAHTPTDELLVEAEVISPELPAQIQLWSLENPTLYRLKFELFEEQTLIDHVEHRFGFREAEFRNDGSFYLNGKPLKLIGLNRHQTYPYIGAAAPARLQRKDADIIKYELGCNIVRTSHYPQSKHFINRCDEIGLLVFEEIPGWQHIGDSDWQGIVLRDVEAMILRDRNHPSIILWGVRVNESQDNEALYRATNDLAHKLDSTRQTGGVRYFQNSQFLEDVFTFNDFSNTVQEPQHIPHLVTEFNGHMFPTKTWDQEERLVEHALRHARIQDKQQGMPNVAGAIGWCAFDYNTHREFGSGDQICYHGVMDIFRLPKYAAYFYESQISPAVRPVLRAATIWSMGDRSGGGNNPLVIFSNCDEVEVFIGDTSYGRLVSDRANFPHLTHPPFQLPGLELWIAWGGKLPELRLVGFYKGRAVVEQRIESAPIPFALELKPDDIELNADGSDMTRLVFRIVDKYGNRLPYATQVVSFEIDGPAELIGENPFALVGGQAALYVRARHETGTVTIRASTSRLQPATATIFIR